MQVFVADRIRTLESTFDIPECQGETVAWLRSRR